MENCRHRIVVIHDDLPAEYHKQTNNCMSMRSGAGLKLTLGTRLHYRLHQGTTGHCPVDVRMLGPTKQQPTIESIDSGIPEPEVTDNIYARTFSFTSSLPEHASEAGATRQGQSGC